MKKKIEKRLVYVLIGIGLLPGIAFVAFTVFVFSVGGGLPASQGVTVEQTEKNIVIYESGLREIASTNGYDFSVLEKEKQFLFQEGNIVEKTFVMQLNSMAEIRVSIRNTPSESKERYSIVCTNQLQAVEEASQNFDLDLLKAIEDEVGHKPFSVKKIEKFLASPEKKYSSLSYGLEKKENMVIYKIISKNFGEGANYQLFALENDTWKECLEYYGDAKNLK